MTFKRLLAPMLIVGLIAGCDNEPASNAPTDEGSSPSASEVTGTRTEEPNRSSDSSVSEPDPKPVASAMSAEDLLKRGKIAFLRCRSCHTLKQDEPHLTGPNLHGLVGATAGVKQGYVFSDALVNSDVVWDESTLDQWLKSPSQFIPGNRMVFAGLPSAEDRQALITYLTAETK